MSVQGLTGQGLAPTAQASVEFEVCDDMSWLLIGLTGGMVALAVYSRWTEPVLPYGEQRQRALFAAPSFVLGCLYGLAVMAWFFYGIGSSDAERQARSLERLSMARASDSELQRRAERLAAAERQLRLEDEAKRVKAKQQEWKRRRAQAVDQRAVEEMSGVVLAGKNEGPCHTLRGCVCGLASQFSDSKILARRYRRWCRGFRSLEGEWMCRSQLQVVKSDLYRNRLVLVEKGLTIPTVCPQRQSN